MLSQLTDDIHDGVFGASGACAIKAQGLHFLSSSTMIYGELFSQEVVSGI